MQFYELCANEDINGLTELVKKGFIASRDTKRTALTQSIYTGRLETLKWLFKNRMVNIQQNKLIIKAILSKKQNIISWILNEYKMNYDTVRSLLSSVLKNNANMLILLNIMEDQEETIIEDFADICNSESIVKIDEYYKQYQYILNEPQLEKTLELAFNSTYVKWIITKKLVDGNKLLNKCIKKDNIIILNLVYKSIQYMFTRHDIIENLNKKPEVYEPIINYIKNEMKYEKLLQLIDSDSLDKVQIYYLKNMVVIHDQITIRSANELLEKSTKHPEIFKWFANLYKVHGKEVEKYLLEAIAAYNKELFLFCKDQLTISEREALEIDKVFTYSEEKKELNNKENYSEMINLLLDNGFQFKNSVGYIVQNLLINDDRVLIERMNTEYKILDDKSKYADILEFVCQGFDDVEIIKWLYSIKPFSFNNDNDPTYEYLIGDTYEMGHYNILEWLVGLYDRYQIIYNDNHDNCYLIDKYDDIEDDSEDWSDSDDWSDSEDWEDSDEDDDICNEIYELVLLQHKKGACKLLGITKHYKNDTNEECIICKDIPKDLIKLNCGHYGCLTCLATWFKNNEELCVYCKKPIQWEKSRKLKRNKQKESEPLIYTSNK